MNEAADQFQQRYDLAQRPAGDPARQQLEAELATMPALERQHWQDVLAETDRLRAAISQSQLPPQLTQSLLAIPLAFTPLPWWRSILHKPVGWMHLAVIALIGGALATWFYWPPRPLAIPTLNDPLVRQIATFAIQNHQHPTLQIATDDPAKIQPLLSANTDGFSPVLPHPTTNSQLLGGGATHLDNASVVFTRWRVGASTSTLFEIDGKALGAPAGFVKTASSPANPNQPRVIIWSGQNSEGTWALVLDNDSAPDCFSDTCR